MRASCLACLGLTALALAACSTPARETTRADAAHSEGGIGGTGLRPDEEGGLGGTGLFGTVTGFGSIRLNGLTVEMPADVPASELAIGATLAVEAARDGDVLRARRVAAVRPLIGPIDEVDPARGELSVMGTAVRLEGLAGFDPATVAPGDWLEVSGIWREGTVVASRIAPVAPQANARVAGLFDGAGAVGGTKVDVACCLPPAAGYAVVTGAYRHGRLVATRAEAGIEALFRPGVERLVVEAFLARNVSDPGFHLSGFGIPMDPASPVPATIGQRAIFVGRLDGSFLIERSYPLPEDPAARARALDRIGPSALLE